MNVLKLFLRKSGGAKASERPLKGEEGEDGVEGELEKEEEISELLASSHSAGDIVVALMTTTYVNANYILRRYSTRMRN